MKTYTYPAEESRCRYCQVFYYLHKGHRNIQHELFHIDSCDEYVPIGNLEYLEWKYEKGVKNV